MNYRKLEEIISYKYSIFDSIAAPDSAVSFTYYIIKSTTMKHLLISILFFSLFFSSCDKGFDYDCTDCTFFYCEVDGEEWTPNCEGTSIGFGCSAKNAKYYNSGSKNIFIFAINEERNESFHIRAKNVTSENNEYQLFLNDDDDFKTKFFKSHSNCNKYVINNGNESDRIFITEIDTINFLIAGVFSFTGYNECGDQVQVSNGKFRLNYTF